MCVVLYASLVVLQIVSEYKYNVMGISISVTPFAIRIRRPMWPYRHRDECTTHFIVGERKTNKTQFPTLFVWMEWYAHCLLPYTYYIHAHIWLNVFGFDGIA